MKQIQKDIFAQSMSRRDFLRLIFAGMLAVFGIHNFLGLLRTQASTESHSNMLRGQSATDFGRSKFGV